MLLHWLQNVRYNYSNIVTLVKKHKIYLL